MRSKIDKGKLDIMKELSRLVVVMQGAADYIDCVYEEDPDTNRAAKYYSDRLKKQISRLWDCYDAIVAN